MFRACEFGLSLMIPTLDDAPRLVDLVGRSELFSETFIPDIYTLANAIDWVEKQFNGGEFLKST